MEDSSEQSLLGIKVSCGFESFGVLCVVIVNFLKERLTEYHVMIDMQFLVIENLVDVNQRICKPCKRYTHLYTFKYKKLLISKAQHAKSFNHYNAQSNF